MGRTTTSPAPADDRALRVLRWLVLTSALLAALLAAVRVVGKMQGDGTAHAIDLPTDLGEMPDFSFRDQTGTVFGKKEMLGRVTIVNFIFTRCPTVCPVFSMKMQRVGEKSSPKVQLLSFSVDPEHDTPKVLAEYARDYDADPERWHFLTGPEPEVRALVEGALKIPMSDEGLDEMGLPNIIHGTHFVLFDQAGRIRGYYNSDDAKRIDQMVRDADYLADHPDPSATP
jgi:protein SCO1/2